MECPHCLHRHVEGDKSTLNAAGAYIPHELDKEGNHVARAEPIDSPTWSYWVSGLASPWAAFGDVAAVLAENTPALFPQGAHAPRARDLTLAKAQANAR